MTLPPVEKRNHDAGMASSIRLLDITLESIQLRKLDADRLLAKTNL